MSEGQARLAELTGELMKSQISPEFFVDKYDADPVVSGRISEYITRENVLGSGRKVKSKEIRPAYVFAAAAASGLEIDPNSFNYNNEQIRKYFYPALSLKMDHEWFLVDDDMQDGGKERRGGPAYHLQHGFKFAINDSAYLEMLSGKVMRSSRNYLEPGIYEKLTDIRTDMKGRTVRGQQMDMKTRDDMQLGLIGFGDMNLEKTVEDIQLWKSSYTNRTGVEYGLAASGCDQNTISKVVPFMNMVTISFQDMDDLIGTTQEESGKGFAPDLDERKLTKLVLGAFNHANMNERDRIRQIFVNGVKDDVLGVKVNEMPLPEKRELIGMMEKYKVTDSIRKSSEDLLNRANQGIMGLFGEKESKEIIELNNYCVYRKF